MFKNIFRLDSSLMILMTQITDCIFLSFFFLLGCLPVLTIGASAAAMYDAMFRGCRKGERNTWIRFWQVFRTNWQAGILPTLVFGVAIWGLAFGTIQCWNAAVYGNISWALFAAEAVLALVGVGILSILFPMLSRFENTSVGMIKNSVILGLANLPRTLILGGLNVMSTVLCLKWILPLFLLPALSALLSSWLIEPMFRPFMPEEPEEEMEEALEEAAL